MMTPQERTAFKHKLFNVIADDANNDASYFKRLCISLQFLSDTIYKFKDDFYNEEGEAE